MQSGQGSAGDVRGGEYGQPIASDAAILIFGPVPLGFRWQLRRINIRAEPIDSPPPTCAVYRNIVSPSFLLDQTERGDFDVADETQTPPLVGGDRIIVYWEGLRPDSEVFAALDYVTERD